MSTVNLKTLEELVRDERRTPGEDVAHPAVRELPQEVKDAIVARYLDVLRSEEGGHRDLRDIVKEAGFELPPPEEGLFYVTLEADVRFTKKVTMRAEDEDALQEQLDDLSEEDVKKLLGIVLPEGAYDEDISVYADEIIPA